jgi:hypothetical protein
MVTKPPTTLKIPKSSTPNVFNTIREVYKETAMVRSILKYSIIVFLAIRLLFSEDIFAVKKIIQFSIWQLTKEQET